MPIKVVKADNFETPIQITNSKMPIMESSTFGLLRMFLDEFDDSSAYMINTVDFETPNPNTDLKPIYPQLVDWDQQGPPTLDSLKNDEALLELMGLRNNMPLGDHNTRFEVMLDI